MCALVHSTVQTNPVGPLYIYINAERQRRLFSGGAKPGGSLHATYTIANVGLCCEKSREHT